MLCACIDIGSNTTRVLVAEVAGGRLRPVLQRKAFTRLGRDVRASGRISETKLTELGEVVNAHREAAERLGVRSLRVVATEALRAIANRAALHDVLARRARVEPELLAPAEEARLAFLGATRTHDEPLAGTLAVVDVGGGSSEVALGTLAGGMRESASFPVGSGVLCDAHPCADPPTAGQIGAMRAHVAGVLDGATVFDGRPPAHALAVGGSATSLCRLVGMELAPEPLAEALRRLASAPAERVARDDGLEVERVRLLPAGIVVLEALASRLGTPLAIGRGGLREGVCIELASRDG